MQNCNEGVRDSGWYPGCSGTRRVLVTASDAQALGGLATRICTLGYDVCTARWETAAFVVAVERHLGAIVVGVPQQSSQFAGVISRIAAEAPAIPLILLTPGTVLRELVPPGAIAIACEPQGTATLEAALRQCFAAPQAAPRSLPPASRLTEVGFIAQSGAGRELLDLVRRVARAGATAVVEGESGTGKELVARLLHHWSERAAGPFVAVNCKAFAEGVLESELFGHERGAFTGAIAARAGCFERASGGTLFLDEIAEAGLDFQAKLLRVLEEREVLRVGGSRPHRVDVRLIAATNRVLRREVEGGRFREDLFFRLNVINLRITPLRERVEDILPLARHFLALNAADPQRLPGFSPEAEALLVSYPWPGNVRELQNAVERALVLNDSGLLTPRDFDLPSHAPTLPSQAAPPPAALSTETLQQHLDRAAAAHIKAALTAARGNRALAASLLNVDRSTLYRLMKKLSPDATLN
ncbi:MAG: sigma-54 dependent transcriptional regulator [Deltaproteobacteria bacterium]|nr:sigma-54 dependent transcriptional regulator [Deltaproteobacteria bacterium]